MTNYFANCTTPDEAKKLYHKLARENHPDHGGDAATMQEINRQYEEFCAGHHAASESAEAAAQAAEEFIATVQALLNIEGITIELCGRWLWISGDTRPVKERLKDLKCRWSGNKKKWYWRPSQEPARHHRGTASMGQIRSKYGSRYLARRADEMAV